MSAGLLLGDLGVVVARHVGVPILIGEVLVKEVLNLCEKVGCVLKGFFLACGGNSLVDGDSDLLPDIVVLLFGFLQFSAKLGEGGDVCGDIEVIVKDAEDVNRLGVGGVLHILRAVAVVEVRVAYHFSVKGEQEVGDGGLELVEDVLLVGVADLSDKHLFPCALVTIEIVDHVDIHPLSVGDRGGFFLIEGDEVEGLEFQSVPIGGVSVQFESFHFSCFLGYTFFSCLLIQR